MYSYYYYDSYYEECTTTKYIQRHYNVVMPVVRAMIVWLIQIEVELVDSNSSILAINIIVKYVEVVVAMIALICS
jgi:hypothetical protein